MSTEPQNERISVSVSTLRAELTGLELRLVDRLNGALAGKADRELQDQLAQRVADLQSRVQGVEATALKSDGPVAARVQAHDESLVQLQAVGGYKKWLWAQTVALAGIAVAIVAVAAQLWG